MADSTRIKKLVVDKDRNLVLTIEKYNAVICLFHSFYGIFVLVFLTGGICSLIMREAICAIVALVFSLFLWSAAWLNANDSLKKRIFTSALLEHFKTQCPEKQEPVLARFYPSLDYIECLEGDGSMNRYSVECVMEKLPLYVVRIHT